MKIEYVRITEPIETREEYADGANVPTRIKVYKCPCGKGRIENHTLSGFGEDFFVIRCKACDKRYAYIERSGLELALYVQGK